MSRFDTISRWLLAALFIYAGIAKAIDPARFALDVYHYRILPHDASAVIALLLPWIEILCGAALVTRRWRPGAVLLLFLMTLVFTSANASAWVRGLDIDCGCFGTGSLKPNYATLRSGLLFIISIALLIRTRRLHGRQEAGE